MTEELKSCPFCGGETLEMDRNNGEWFVTCYECPCQGVEGNLTREQAIKAWNTRAETK